jgi:hypothetical protein
MDTGSTGLADLKTEVEAMTGGAYLQAILCRTGDGWNLYHVRALIGIEPPGWTEQTWRYEELALSPDRSADIPDDKPGLALAA